MYSFVSAVFIKQLIAWANCFTATLRISYNDSSYTDLSMASTQQNILSIHKFQPIPMVYEVRTTSPNYLDWLTGRTMFDYYWMNRQNPSSCLSTSSYFSPNCIEQDYSTKFIVEEIISFILKKCLNNHQNIIVIKDCQFENNLSYNIISLYSLLCSIS